MSLAQRLVVVGGSGFLGRALARHFSAQGWRVTTVSRTRPDAPGDWHPWDGLRQGTWSAALNGAAAVVNLAGRSVNCHYSARNMLDIYTSRLDATRAVARAIRGCAAPPAVWLNASTATLYRHAEDRPQDEATGEVGHGFSVDVARRWEAALWEAALPGTRRVALRAAMVYGAGAGGVMQTTDRLVRLGLGGAVGDGRQYMSWLHLQDFVRSVQFLIGHDLAGPVNLSAPQPLPNADFMRAYRRAWGVPLGLPAPLPLPQVGAWLLNTEAELLLKSRWVVPGRLQAAGFQFSHPSWPAAARDLVAEVRAHGHRA